MWQTRTVIDDMGGSTRLSCDTGCQLLLLLLGASGEGEPGRK